MPGESLLSQPASLSGQPAGGVLRGVLLVMPPKAPRKSWFSRGGTKPAAEEPSQQGLASVPDQSSLRWRCSTAVWSQCDVDGHTRWELAATSRCTVRLVPQTVQSQYDESFQSGRKLSRLGRKPCTDQDSPPTSQSVMAFHDMDFPGDVTDLPGLHRAHVLYSKPRTSVLLLTMLLFFESRKLFQDS